MQARQDIPSPRRIFIRALRNASGITLIEVLICSLVVGVGAVALAVMFANGQTVIAGEGDNRVAVYLAQQKIERCRAEGFAGVLADLPSGTVLPVTTTEQLDATFVGAVTSCYNATPPTNPNPFYTRTTTVDCVSVDDYSVAADCSAPAFAQQVTVTVQGNENVRNTRSRPATLRAVLANR